MILTWWNTHTEERFLKVVGKNRWEPDEPVVHITPHNGLDKRLPDRIEP